MWELSLEGGITAILRWKASQYRLLALYVGIVIFKHKDVVPDEIYMNYLHFAVAMRLLLTADQEENLPFVEYILKKFVDEAQNIYEKSFNSYNVHHLVHLSDDYMKYGCLGNVSCFPFESYLGVHVKGSVRGGFKPLNQIAVHIEKQNSVISNLPQTSSGVCSKENKHRNHCITGNCTATISLQVTAL
jgi:hypothetical protein